MKNIAIFTLLFATTFGGFSASSYGQHEITEKDVRDRVSAAKAQLKSLAFRQEKIVERFEDKNKLPSQRTEFTAIFSPPDSSHTILVSQGRSGHTRTETIAIGKTKYTKENEGEWLSEPRDNYSLDIREYGRWGEPNPKIETLVENKGKGSKSGISSDHYVITNKYTSPLKNQPLNS
jgi:hypothetical protein